MQSTHLKISDNIAFMIIKHTDLPLISKLLEICTPFNLNTGTVTAFVNYCMASPFIDVQDKRFEYYVRSMGEYITFHRVHDENPTLSFYNNLKNENIIKRVMLASDPVTKLDTYNISYDGMQAIIKLVCAVLEIEDKFLYNKAIETETVEDYIEIYAFPTLHKYLSVFDLKDKITQAIEAKQGLDIEFYPEKLKTIFDSYLYTTKKDEYIKTVEKILDIT
jgi:hypothetical protein